MKRSEKHIQNAMPLLKETRKRRINIVNVLILLKAIFSKVSEAFFKGIEQDITKIYMEHKRLQIPNTPYSHATNTIKLTFANSVILN